MMSVRSSSRIKANLSATEKDEKSNEKDLGNETPKSRGHRNSPNVSESGDGNVKSARKSASNTLKNKQEVGKGDVGSSDVVNRERRKSERNSQNEEIVDKDKKEKVSQKDPVTPEKGSKQDSSKGTPKSQRSSVRSKGQSEKSANEVVTPEKVGSKSSTKNTPKTQETPKQNSVPKSTPKVQETPKQNEVIPERRSSRKRKTFPCTKCNQEFQLEFLLEQHSYACGREFKKEKEDQEYESPTKTPATKRRKLQENKSTEKILQTPGDKVIKKEKTKSDVEKSKPEKKIESTPQLVTKEKDNKTLKDSGKGEKGKKTITPMLKVLCLQPKGKEVEKDADKNVAMETEENDESGREKVIQDAGENVKESEKECQTEAKVDGEKNEETGPENNKIRGEALESENAKEVTKEKEVTEELDGDEAVEIVIYKVMEDENENDKDKNVSDKDGKEMDNSIDVDQEKNKSDNAINLDDDEDGDEIVEDDGEIVEDDGEIEEDDDPDYNEDVKPVRRWRSKKDRSKNEIVSLEEVEKMVDLNSKECPICHMQFKEFKYMKRHLIVHTGSKMETCDICRKSFIRKYDLQMHLVRVHNWVRVRRGKVIPRTKDMPVDIDLDLVKDESSSGDAVLNIKPDADGIYHCTACETTCKSKPSFEQHMNIHTGQTPFKCDKCEESFTHRNKLHHHKRNVHGDYSSYTCEECGKTYRFQFALAEHLRTHSGEKSFLCDHCGKGFSLQKYLVKHKQRHASQAMRSDKQYECRYCNEFFNDLGDYQTHMRTHNEDEIRTHHCSECPKRFFKFAHLRRHLMTHTKVRDHLCHICEKAYKDADTLRKHIRYIHDTNRNNDEREKTFQCDRCSKSFYNKGHLKRHINKHLGIRPFKCDYCSRAFGEKKSLENHLRTHTGERPHQCAICKKRFIQMSHLRRHSYQHSQERNWECSTCHKRFFEKGDLAKHQRVHSKDRPFECDICQQKFSQPNILKAHRRRHTGEKPYVCDICNRAFTQMGAMQCHRRLHTGERPYKCDYCGLGFVSRERMKFHTYIHTGLNPHICHICGKGFRLKFKLQSHIDTHEGVYRHQCKICCKGFIEKTKLNRHIKQVHTDHPTTRKTAFVIPSSYIKNENSMDHNQLLRNLSEIAVSTIEKDETEEEEEVIETTTIEGIPYEIQTEDSEEASAVSHITLEGGEITSANLAALYDGSSSITIPSDSIIYEGGAVGEEVVYVVIPEENQTVILS